MCVIAFAYKLGGYGQLSLLANRDEYYTRPASPLDWCRDEPQTLGGRDLKSGGSWLMVDARGRFAAVTNIRQGYGTSGTRSRGLIVESFVTGDADALDFIKELQAQRTDYAPFNLLFGRTDDLFHYHSLTDRLVRVTPGFHALSNATLDTPWFKCEQLKERLKALGRPPREEEAFAWLADPTPAPPERLPNTGIGGPMERVLSPVFVNYRDYGTCASMLLNVSARGDVSFHERSIGLAGRETGTRRYTMRPAVISRQPGQP